MLHNQEALVEKMLRLVKSERKVKDVPSVVVEAVIEALFEKLPCIFAPFSEKGNESYSDPWTKDWKTTTLAELLDGPYLSLCEDGSIHPMKDTWSDDDGVTFPLAVWKALDNEDSLGMPLTGMSND